MTVTRYIGHFRCSFRQIFKENLPKYKRKHTQTITPKRTLNYAEI